MSKIEELIQELCPDGVECITLGSIGSFQNIGTDKKIVDGEREVRLLNYMDVYKNKYIDNKIPKMIVTANEKKYEECTALYGDIFVTPTSETRDDIGHASVITEDLVETCYSYHIMRYRLHRQCIVTSKYVRYAIESDDCKKQIYKFAQGMTRYGLSIGKFEQLQIPIPPLAIQEEIVHILDSMTDLTDSLKIELDARRKQYEYYRDALLEFGEDVPRKELGEICTVITGGEPPKDCVKGSNPDLHRKYAVWGNGIEVYGYSSNYQIDRDAVVISSIGANTGAVYFRKAFFTPIIRLKVILPKSDFIQMKFLFYYLSNIKIGSKSGSVPNLNSSDVKSLMVQVPPIEVQQQIVEILDKFDAYCNDIAQGLPAEIEMRTKQYEYYRDKLLSFKDINEK